MAKPIQDVLNDVFDSGNNALKVSAGAGGDDKQIQYNNDGDMAGDANLIWDDVNKRLGLGEATPDAPFHLTSTEVLAAQIEYVTRTRFRNSSTNAAIEIWSNGTPSYAIQYGMSGQANVGLSSGDHIFDTYSPGTNWKERMRITNGGQVVIGSNTATTSSVLDVKSTTGAFMPPRMTTTQRDALTASNGMMLYNTTTNQFEGYQNGGWAAL